MAVPWLGRLVYFLSFLLPPKNRIILPMTSASSSTWPASKYVPLLLSKDPYSLPSLVMNPTSVESRGRDVDGRGFRAVLVELEFQGARVLVYAFEGAEVRRAEAESDEVSQT